MDVLLLFKGFLHYARWSQKLCTDSLQYSKNRSGIIFFTNYRKEYLYIKLLIFPINISINPLTSVKIAKLRPHY